MKDFAEALHQLLHQTDWGSSDFGESVMKAELKKQLHKIKYIDENNKIYYGYESTQVDDEDIGYFASNGRKTYKFIFGKVTYNDNNSTVNYASEKNFPPFAKLVVDYLIGKYAFTNDGLYDVSKREFQLIDDYTLQARYGFKDANHILEILAGIHNRLNIKPSNQIELFKIACSDFIIDLEYNNLIAEPPKQNVSYFKFYDVDFETAERSRKLSEEFLQNVIADSDSLHNAMLQPYYISQVASGVRAKTNFFISKSGVRTGKGLRHIALSCLFKKIDVELDTLKSNGFESLQAWATFAGGEMALATEQGDIQGLAMERVLKIIATEKSHVARSIGQNQANVTLSSVLCIDTNRTVALSDEMNGRKVLIQFKDRPSEETDIEREEFFSKYWNAFADKNKNPKISGCIGFLLNSLSYFKKLDCKYIWKNVEVNNDIDLDEFQIALLNALQEVDFVQRTDNSSVIELSNQTYGKNKNALGKAISEIGVKSNSKKINGKTVRGYIIENKERFNKFID